MNEKLITGYTAYTTADEYGAAALTNAPAYTTSPFLTANTVASLWPNSSGI